MPILPFDREDDGSNPKVKTFWASMDAMTALTNVSEANIIALTTAVQAIQKVLALLGHRMDSVESNVASLTARLNKLDGSGPVTIPDDRPPADTNPGTAPPDEPVHHLPVIPSSGSEDTPTTTPSEPTPPFSLPPVVTTPTQIIDDGTQTPPNGPINIGGGGGGGDDSTLLNQI